MWISNNDEQCLGTSNCHIERLRVTKKPNGVTNVRTNQWGVRTDLSANQKEIELINERVERKIVAHIDKRKWKRTVANDSIGTVCTTRKTNRKNLRCFGYNAKKLVKRKLNLNTYFLPHKNFHLQRNIFSFFWPLHYVSGIKCVANLSKEGNVSYRCTRRPKAHTTED